MTFFKSLFRKRLIRLCLFSILLQTALFAQFSFYPENSDVNSSNEYYDSEPISELVESSVPLECISIDGKTYCHPEDLKCFETSDLKYYDPTTQNFSSDSHVYQLEVDRDTLPYYDHRFEAEKRKYYPPVKLEDIPYYEPPEPIISGAVVNEGEIHLPPEVVPGEISKESPLPNIEKERTIQQNHPVVNPKEQPKSSLNEGQGSLQQQKPPQSEEKPMPVGTLQSVGRPPRPIEMGQINSPHSLEPSRFNDDIVFNDSPIEDTSPIAQASQPAQKKQGSFTPGQRSMQMISPNSPIPSNFPFNNMLRRGKQQPDRRTAKDISLSFNNVPIIEYIRYISKVAGRNFVFNEEDLQFNITVVTEQMESIETLMTSLLQELKIRDLSILEQANNIIIHRNPRVKAPARIVSTGTEPISGTESEIVTRIFNLRTLDPQKAAEIIRPILSDAAAIEVLKDSNKLIITDLVSNANRVAQMIGSLDAPNSGVQIGQYIVRNAHVDTLVDLAGKILQPIAQGNPFILVPNVASKTVYVVSNQYLVQKTLAILEQIDTHEGKTNVLSLEKLAPEGVSSQGAFGKRQARRVTGVVPSGEVESGGGISAIEGEEGVRVGQPGVYAGQPFPPGVPPMPAGFEGTPEEWLYMQGYLSPEGLPLRPLTSEGRLMNAMGEMEGEAGGNYSIGVPYSPYGVATGPGVLTSQGYLRGTSTEAFPYGAIQSYGAPGTLEEGRDFLPGGISTRGRFISGLPTGYILPRHFHIRRLNYLQGSEVELALRNVANDLILAGQANPELITAINSSQWDPESNSLTFFGTTRAIKKIDEFIKKIDYPIGQVFIEMLILEMDFNDSLTFGVEWLTNFGGGSINGNEGFLFENNNPLAAAVNNINLGTTLPTLPSFSPANLPFPGYAAAIVGTHLTHNGIRFNTIGALIQAARVNNRTNIVLNPHILAEDGVSAQVFVGSVDRYKSQSITNSNNALVTNNFQFIDVGAMLRVTPRIGNNGIITLEVVEERSTANQNANVPNTNTQNDFSLIPVINKDRTVTEAHIPDGCFAILSGLLSDQESRIVSQIPCLGGIPIIGGLCKSRVNTVTRTNIMIFVRPKIIRTPEDFEDLTKRRQDVWCEKQKSRRAWNFEIDETLDQFNIKPTDPDEIGCGGCNQ